MITQIYYRSRLLAISLLMIIGFSMGTEDVWSAPSFLGLGDLSGGVFDSRATFVSPDGMTVLGTSQSAVGHESFKWTQGGGMVTFGLFPDGDFSSGSPSAITNDGAVISGTGVSSSGFEAFRWTQASGVIGLGDLPGGTFRSDANAMSADGSAIVGESRIGSQVSDSEAFIWTQANGMVGLSDLPTGMFSSEAWDVSADGSVVVGEGTIVLPGDITEAPKGRAFRWTEAEGMVDLGTPLTGQHTRATTISGNGQLIAGNNLHNNGDVDAFMWTAGSGMVLLDDPPQGGFDSRPADASFNGSVIVGQSFSPRFGSPAPEAFVWDQLGGSQYLIDVLTGLGLDLTGWTLESATGISDDGLTIVGTGINPDGNQEAFIATLPEPGTLVVMTAGTAMLLRRRIRV
jgi:uncharacterized membrane protein